MAGVFGQWSGYSPLQNYTKGSAYGSVAAPGAQTMSTGLGVNPAPSAPLPSPSMNSFGGIPAGVAISGDSSGPDGGAITPGGGLPQTGGYAPAGIAGAGGYGAFAAEKGGVIPSGPGTMLNGVKEEPYRNKWRAKNHKHGVKSFSTGGQVDPGEASSEDLTQGEYNTADEAGADADTAPQDANEANSDANTGTLDVDQAFNSVQNALGTARQQFAGGLFDPINKALQGQSVAPQGKQPAQASQDNSGGQAIPQDQIDSSYWQQNGGIKGSNGFFGPPNTGTPQGGIPGSAKGGVIPSFADGGDIDDPQKNYRMAPIQSDPSAGTPAQPSYDAGGDMDNPMGGGMPAQAGAGGPGEQVQGSQQQPQGGNQQSMMAYATGAGALPSEEAAALEARVPQSVTDPQERKAMAIANADPKTQVGLLQHYRAKFNAYSQLAAVAARGTQNRPPDMGQAAQAANMAFQNVPGPTKLTAQPSQNGLAISIRGRGGKKQQSAAKGGVISFDAGGDTGDAPAPADTASPTQLAAADTGAQDNTNEASGTTVDAPAQSLAQLMSTLHFDSLIKDQPDMLTQKAQQIVQQGSGGGGSGVITAQPGMSMAKGVAQGVGDLITGAQNMHARNKAALETANQPLPAGNTPQQGVIPSTPTPPSQAQPVDLSTATAAPVPAPGTSTPANATPAERPVHFMQPPNRGASDAEIQKYAGAVYPTMNGRVQREAMVGRYQAQRASDEQANAKQAGQNSRLDKKLAAEQAIASGKTTEQLQAQEMKDNTMLQTAHAKSLVDLARSEIANGNADTAGEMAVAIANKLGVNASSVVKAIQQPYQVNGGQNAPQAAAPASPQGGAPGATRSYNGATYVKQPDGTWKKQ